MELEPVYMPIRKVDDVTRAYLGLEGTILLLDQRQAATDFEFMIPVELVTVSEGSRHEWRWLLAAALSLFAPVLLSVASLILLFGSVSVKTSNSPVFGVLVLVLLGMPLVGLIAFLVLVVVFFFRVKTVRLDIRSGSSVGAEPGGLTIEFYRRRKQMAEIDSFIEQIRFRQCLVGELLAEPVNRTAGFVKEHSDIPRFAALLLMASLPLLMTTKAQLLVLPAAVIVWFIYRRVQYGRQPREYRQALQHYLRGDHDGAIGILEGLRGHLPEYLPTYSLLAQAYVREGRFDEALATASCLARGCPEVAQTLQTNIWLFKRIHERRQISVG